MRGRLNKRPRLVITGVIRVSYCSIVLIEALSSHAQSGDHPLCTRSTPEALVLSSWINALTFPHVRTILPVGLSSDLKHAATLCFHSKKPLVLCPVLRAAEYLFVQAFCEQSVVFVSRRASVSLRIGSAPDIVLSTASRSPLISSCSTQSPSGVCAPSRLTSR